MIKNNENFWERLQSLLIEKKINSKQLGIAIGVQGASITGWKNGSYPRADTAVKIAQFLGTSVEFLMTGEDPQGITSDEIQLVCKWRLIGAESRRTALLIIDDAYEKAVAAQKKKKTRHRLSPYVVEMKTF